MPEITPVAGSIVPAGSPLAVNTSTSVASASANTPGHTERRDRLAVAADCAGTTAAGSPASPVAGSITTGASLTPVTVTVTVCSTEVVPSLTV
ncbi:MAG: hypothetical protein R3D33_07350 [Hyphomicrobiaceae bacterium]